MYLNLCWDLEFINKKLQVIRILTFWSGSVRILQSKIQIPDHIRQVLLLVFYIFCFSSAFSQSTVKIGFLIRDKNDISIKQAAELAIEHANSRGGYKGRNFELVIKSCDGPWGMTSKQTVSLIYDDQVPIIVTALDGQNAHLAEQVTAKSHVVMLSALSSDPTLSRAYVPWYFRMVPDDKQQAEMLARKIYGKDGDKMIALISFDDYDGKMSTEALLSQIADMGYSKPDMFIGLNQTELLEKVNGHQYDVIVLAGSSTFSGPFISQIQGSEIYGFQNLTNFIQEDNISLFNKISFMRAKSYDQSKWEKFENSYKQKFMTVPNPSLAYVYDGIFLAIESLKKYSPDSESIRLGFKDTKYEGITGKIEFGNLGNRIF
jgi:branched-chain amino acid transport system substrate-binding protein